MLSKAPVLDACGLSYDTRALSFSFSFPREIPKFINTANISYAKYFWSTQNYAYKESDRQKLGIDLFVIERS